MADTAAKMQADKDWAASVISKVIKLDPDLSNAITKKCTFRTHLHQLEVDNMVNDYNNLVLRDVMPADPGKDWWRSFLYDATLKAAAPRERGLRSAGEVGARTTMAPRPPGPGRAGRRLPPLEAGLGRLPPARGVNP